MAKLIGAMTKPGVEYPGYVNASRDDDGMVVLTVRGDPRVNETSIYICGYASDRGKPGRCTPGDENCNNYCNSAPEKGPMQDHPKPCRQVYEGDTVSLRLTDAEFSELLREITPARPEKLDAERFDQADWYWRTMDPDDNGDTAEQAVHSSMLGTFCVCEIASSFTGPTRYGFLAELPDSDEQEFRHFATQEEAVAACKEAHALVNPSA